MLNRYSTDTLKNGCKVVLINGLYVVDSNTGKPKEWIDERECFAWVQACVDADIAARKQCEKKKTLFDKIRGLLH